MGTGSRGVVEDFEADKARQTLRDSGVTVSLSARPWCAFFGLAETCGVPIRSDYDCPLVRSATPIPLAFSHHRLTFLWVLFPSSGRLADSSFSPGGRAARPNALSVRRAKKRWQAVCGMGLGSGGRSTTASSPKTAERHGSTI